MKRTIFVALGLIGLAIAACNKDDDDKNATELITSTTWKIDTLGFDLDADGDIDSPIIPALEECGMDNTITFSSDSTGVFSYGALKCNVAEPDNISFDWSFKENDKVINIDGNLPGDLQGDVDILTLNDSQLILSKEVTITNPITVTGHLIVSLKK